jgi:hypothetical protein
MTDPGGFPKVFCKHLTAGGGGEGSFCAQFIKIVSRSAPRRRMEPAPAEAPTASRTDGCPRHGVGRGPTELRRVGR